MLEKVNFPLPTIFIYKTQQQYDHNNPQRKKSRKEKKMQKDFKYSRERQLKNFESESNLRRLGLITKRELLGGTTTQTCENDETMQKCTQSLTNLDICHYKIKLANLSEVCNMQMPHKFHIRSCHTITQSGYPSLLDFV